jgi:general secretion pathway protein G
MDKFQERPLNRTMRRCKASGFTLIEMLLVLALIGLVVAAVSAKLFGSFSTGQERTARIQVRDLAGTVLQFRIDNDNTCPADGAALVAARLLNKVPKDPWGNLIQIRCPGDKDQSGADVYSFGRDEVEGTADDIGSWQ